MTGYFELRTSDRRDLLAALAPELGFRPEALEKDIGICWALEKLSMIEALSSRMALKGGTSLSKVYGLIHRFSEDVDLTVDYHTFLDGEDPDLSALGRSEKDRLAVRLKHALLELLSDAVIPVLGRHLHELSDDSEIRFRPMDELIILRYPSTLESWGTYLKEEIFLEFGARNVISPFTTSVIEPMIASRVPNLRMPTAAVQVLGAERTFWEKATLIHVACNRGFESRSAERQSRHWYDLALLSRSKQGRSAIADRALLSDVIRIKKTFFNSAHARYDECLSGGLRLIPSEPGLSALQRDYDAMTTGGMFHVEPPAFAELLEELSTMQDSINESGALSHTPLLANSRSSGITVTSSTAGG